MRSIVSERIIAAIEALDLQPPEPGFDRPVDELRAILEGDRKD